MSIHKDTTRLGPTENAETVMTETGPSIIIIAIHLEHFKNHAPVQALQRTNRTFSSYNYLIKQVMHPTFLRGGSPAPAEQGEAETRWTRTTHLPGPCSEHF